MPNPLAVIKKNGAAYVLLTPDEGFLVGQVEKQPVAFLFSQRKLAKAYLEKIGKAEHKISKEDAQPLLEELVEAGVKNALVDPEDIDVFSDPLFLPKYLEHLSKAG